MSELINAVIDELNDRKINYELNEAKTELRITFGCDRMCRARRHEQYKATIDVLDNLEGSFSVLWSDNFAGGGGDIKRGQLGDAVSEAKRLIRVFAEIVKGDGGSYPAVDDREANP